MGLIMTHSRGPDFELQNLHEVEDMKRSMSKENIHVTSGAILRGIALPRHVDTSDD